MYNKMGEQKVIGFWEAGKPYVFMSQWYYSDFIEDGINFNTCEKYMMYNKAKLFNDQENASKILKVHAPFKIKKLGKQVKWFDQEKWDSVKENIIFKGNLLHPWTFKMNLIH